MKRFKVTILTGWWVGLALALPNPSVSEDLTFEKKDNPWTKEVDEGAITSGRDNPFTREINEGRINTGRDDPFTEGIDEGRIFIEKNNNEADHSED